MVAGAQVWGAAFVAEQNSCKEYVSRVRSREMCPTPRPLA
jgi:hypothetical protein